MYKEESIISRIENIYAMHKETGMTGISTYIFCILLFYWYFPIEY